MKSDLDATRLDQLSQDVLCLSRDGLLVHLRFMDQALNQLKLVPEGKSIAVDGANIYYNPKWVLKCYQSNNMLITRDYLHMVLHCVFKHFCVSQSLNLTLWNLSCDIAVETVISELDIPWTHVQRENIQNKAYDKIKLSVRAMTAENIYRYLVKSDLPSEVIIGLQMCFKADDHSLWYGDNNSNNTSESSPDRNDKNNPDENQQPNSEQSFNNSDHSTDEQSTGNSNKTHRTNFPDQLSHNQSPSERRNQIEQTWDDISNRIQTDLETYSNKWGTKSANLLFNLSAATRSKYNYRDFLYRFSSLHENMRVNDDEFDYIYYSYGLQLYGNMPLIEPLEYKEQRLIDEFVIAIDTSGSITLPQAQAFLNETYTIFHSEESFAKKINLHIIQCDAEIHSDKKVTSQTEFDDYVSTLQIEGGGGTDFRPVFQHIERLQKSGELAHLKGMIYFSDGYGTFPNTPPPYNAAFVFLNEAPPHIPPWVIELTLQEEQLGASTEYR